MEAPFRVDVRARRDPGLPGSRAEIIEDVPEFDATITSTPGCVIMRAASASTCAVVHGRIVRAQRLGTSSQSMECCGAFDLVASRHPPRARRGDSA